MKPTEMVLRPAFKLAYLLMIMTLMACLVLLFFLYLFSQHPIRGSSVSERNLFHFA